MAPVVPNPKRIKAFRSEAAFEAWLLVNHAREPELWLRIYKKGAGKATVTSAQALDVVLCWGWIDGIRKRYNAQSYTIRFTPRKPGSIWSQVNIKKVRALIAAGRMKPRGLKEFQNRDESKTRLYSYERDHAKLDAAREARFRANRKAWAFFEAQPPGYKKKTLHWVVSAKREETRDSRLAQLIKLSAKGVRGDLLKPRLSP